MEASPVIRPSLWTPQLQVAASVDAQPAFSTAAPMQPPTLGSLLEPAWSPYGALVRVPGQPLHNFAAGALLFDAFA